MINTKHRIEFDPEKCIGCQQCYKSCFVDVIRWDAEAKKPVFKQMRDARVRREFDFFRVDHYKFDLVRLRPV